MSAKSSSGTTHQPRHPRRPSGDTAAAALRTGFSSGTLASRTARRAPKPPSIPAEVLDSPAVKAMLDWHDRGQPDSEIDTSDAPELTAEQLAEMEKAYIRIGRPRRRSLQGVTTREG